ncbi:50S ribosomal protein L25/general stress protein Ctc [Blastococcus sp. MG754426]|uniref:50S ribosomal protein L25/general stress protein Ctc n=1 Tax=unclassified Blastococcus TaxID=2619396 RepID=UPI001EEF8867|nr:MULTISPECIES: 50S ribosomal protein L25/general stress protein Ctc [unclassified Blastococcus]MCF6509017.1 50S ribosomal protein L25/general stress protein Ctc [Blastococcus sp. MG754426]MCF6513604.1 50S ribosomal protein L25/general stress protein Ctc [Blastococcus sp. MG754427]MCF6734600.1 50S ribosomal protein L25/general stress protein Ctc [Blastococcus sp. KM273129]
MADFRLEAETRTEFGKGSARRTRRAGRVPAVLYGHGQDVVHLSLPAREFAAALRNGGSNVLLTVVLEGKEQLALTKAVQRDPLTRVHEHVDLLVVRRGEKVTVDVPVHVTGDAAPETLVSIELNTVSVEVPATAIPEAVEVDVTGREAGQGVHANELTLPRGATLLTDAEALVVNVMAAPTAEALEAELAEAEAEVGIEREESAEAAEGAGEGDVVPEPLDQGSGESMDAAENSKND